MKGLRWLWKEKLEGSLFLLSSHFSLILPPCLPTPTPCTLTYPVWNPSWSPCQVPLMVVPRLICLSISNVWHVVGLNYYSVLRLFPSGSPGIVSTFHSVFESLLPSIPPLPTLSLPFYLAWRLKFVWLYSCILTFVGV